MFGSSKKKQNRWIVFDIEDNLPDNIKSFEYKSEAKKYFHTMLLRRGLSPKEVALSLKTSIYLEKTNSLSLVDLD